MPLLTPPPHWFQFLLARYSSRLPQGCSRGLERGENRSCRPPKPLCRVQWHPFSISSFNGQHEKGIFTVHIKDMGPNTWTHAVRGLEPTNRGVSVDGPFGNL